MPNCPAKTWSYQGLDLIRCSLPKGHEGNHRSEGPFTIDWDDAEAQKVQEQAMFLRSLRSGEGGTVMRPVDKVILTLHTLFVLCCVVFVALIIGLIVWS